MADSPSIQHPLRKGTPDAARAAVSSSGTPRAVIAKLLLAVKNYGLYPEDHVIQQSALTEFMLELEAFFKTGPSFPIQISREELIVEEEILHQAPPTEGNLAFQLYRDGIQKLVFHHGIQQDEIQALFKIIEQYKHQAEESGGDIVTSLWEADFTHLSYDTTEIIWENDPLIDLSRMTVTDQKNCDLQHLRDMQPAISSIADTTLDSTLWELTPREIQHTTEQVMEEESRDFNIDLFDVLLVILKEQQDEEDFATVLDIIRECFQNTLASGEFIFAEKFLKSMHEIYITYKQQQFWAVPHLEDFFIMISSRQVLSSLHQFWAHPKTMDAEQLKQMHETLIYLSPQAIHTLVPMLFQVHPFSLENTLMSVITELAQKDILPLTSMLNHPNETYVQKATFLLGHVSGTESTEALVRMLNSPLDRVRFEAAKTLIRRAPLQIGDLFPLIEDPSQKIRQLVLRHLGKERNETAENMIIEAINKQGSHRKNRQRLWELYEALGGCCSPRSIPFLKRNLKHRALLSGLGSSMHQRGAALALIKLNTDDANNILNKAAKSRYPSIRNAYKQSLDVINGSK